MTLAEFKETMKKKLFIAGLIVFVVALGFFRDYVFVSINEKTGQGPIGSGNLFYWKWILTFVFILQYLVLTCLFLHLLFGEKKYIWLGIYVYTALVAVSFIAGGAGVLFSSFEKVYPFIRTVLGIAQSPIIIMILTPVCYLNEAMWKSKK